jgi:hypothetical protein
MPANYRKVVRRLWHRLEREQRDNGQYKGVTYEIRTERDDFQLTRVRRDEVPGGQ